MLVGVTGFAQELKVTLYTAAGVVRGTVRSRYRRITDVLNERDTEHLVLTDVETREYGGRAATLTSPFAQVSLDAVLFAVSDVAVEPVPELRTPKVSEPALVEAPPFTISGRIHLLPERDLGEALAELAGRFVPLTEATFWSETVGEARTSARVVAVNHARTQILAPHRGADRWQIAGAGEARTDVTGEDAPPVDGGWAANPASAAEASAELPEMRDLPRVPEPPAMPERPDMPGLPGLPRVPEPPDRAER